MNFVIVCKGGQVHKFWNTSRAGPFRQWMARWGNGCPGKKYGKLFALAGGHGGGRQKRGRSIFRRTAEFFRLPREQGDRHLKSSAHILPWPEDGYPIFP